MRARDLALHAGTGLCVIRPASQRCEFTASNLGLGFGTDESLAASFETLFSKNSAFLLLLAVTRQAFVLRLVCLLVGHSSSDSLPKLLADPVQLGFRRRQLGISGFTVGSGIALLVGQVLFEA